MVGRLVAAEAPLTECAVIRELSREVAAQERPVQGWGWVSYWVPWVAPFDTLAFNNGVRQLHAHNAWLDVWMQLGILGLLAFAVVIPVGLVFVTFTLTGGLEMFTSRRGQSIAVVAMCFAVLGSIAGLVSGWRRGGVGYVKLTPSGVDVADIFRTESVAWDDIDDVDDHSDIDKKTRKAVVLRRRDGSEKVIDGCDFYVPNGVGLYWMVRHYWRHPDDRAELTDGRSLARLDEGRFDTDMA